MTKSDLNVRSITAHDVGRGDLCYCKAHQREWDGPMRDRGRCSACGLRIWIPFRPDLDGVVMSKADYDALIEQIETEKKPKETVPPWEPRPFIRDGEGFVSIRIQQGQSGRNGVELSELVMLIVGYLEREQSGPRASRPGRRVLGHLRTVFEVLRAMENRSK